MTRRLTASRRRDQRRIGQLLGEAYRHVHAFLHQIDRTVRHLQRDAQLGVAPEELRDQR